MKALAGLKRSSCVDEEDWAAGITRLQNNNKQRVNTVHFLSVEMEIKINTVRFEMFSVGEQSGRVFLPRYLAGPCSAS